MQAPRNTWIIGLLLVTLGSGCDGGRGSTGFDITENAAIELVLETQECVRRRLELCPADQSPVPTADMTATPTPTEPPVTPPLPTTTPEPDPTPRIDTGLANGVSIVCTRAVVDGPCTLTFAFAGIGFPAGAFFHVSSRLLEPMTGWELAPPPVPATSDPSVLAAEVTVPVPLGAAAAEAQFAVLVFLSQPATIPARFDELAQSGADYAFVTPDYALEIVTIEVPPTLPPTPTATEPTPAPPTPTATPTVVTGGPVITYFGVARADSLALAPTAFDDLGRPIYVRSIGSGLTLIIEGQPGPSRRAVGGSAYSESGGLPDLQVILANPIGDGSVQVCDASGSNVGGVPAASPFEFSTAPAVVDAINDLGCRVDDGRGSPQGRGSSDACTQDRDGEFRYVDASSTLQFCLPIASAWAFPGGDTIVAARLRDTGGEVGPAREIVVRIAASAPPTATPSAGTPSAGTPTVATPSEVAVSPTSSALPPTPTTEPPPSPTPTPTPTPEDDGPVITHFGLARADSQPLTAIISDEMGRPVYDVLVGQGMSLIIEGQPGPTRRALGVSAYNQNGLLPDLQLIVSRALGNGSVAVCDLTPPQIGGVPATMPLVFSDTPAAVDAINDLGCRVNDGTGQPIARRNPFDACTISNSSVSGFDFLNRDSTVQYCLPIARAWNFPAGPTVVAVRLRDTAGRLSEPAEIVVRVATPPEPPQCPGEQRLLTFARPASMLQTSFSGTGDVSTDPWDPGPLPLCVGPQLEDGTRSLHLRNDLTFGLGVVDGSVLCAHLWAQGSTGRIDCDGGTAHDVIVSQDSRGADASGSVAVEIGLGDDAGAGAATVSAQLSLRLLPVGTSIARCQTVNYNSRFPVALTTASATSRIDNASQGGEVAIAARGSNFDCARVTESDSPGTLAMPFPAPDTFVGDVAGVLLLAD
jgi:hypothetical protein